MLPTQSNSVAALQAALQARKMVQDATTAIGANLSRDVELFNAQVERSQESKRKDELNKAQVDNANAQTAHTQMRTQHEPATLQAQAKSANAMAHLHNVNANATEYSPQYQMNLLAYEVLQDPKTRKKARQSVRDFMNGSYTDFIGSSSYGVNPRNEF